MSNAYAGQVMNGRQIFQDEKRNKCNSGNRMYVENGFGNIAKPRLIPIKSLRRSPLKWWQLNRSNSKQLTK